MLVVLLSLLFAVVAQAQTDTGESGSGDGDKGPGVTPRQFFQLPIQSNVRVVGSDNTTVVVNWDAVDEAVYPRVEYIRLERSSNNSTWSNATTVSGYSGSASVTGLTCGTRYYFRVRALGYVEPVEGDPSGSVSGRTIPCPAPAPSGFSSTAKDDRISASWSAVNGGIGISRYNFGIRKGSFWYSRSVGTSTSAEEFGLTPATYKIRVQACGDGVKYSTDCGVFAEVDVTVVPTQTPTPTPTPTTTQTATPTPTPTPTPIPGPISGKLPTPSGFTVTPNLSEERVYRVRLSWNPVPTAAGYLFERLYEKLVDIAMASHTITVTQACCTRAAPTAGATSAKTTPSVQLSGLPTTLDLGAQESRPYEFTVIAAGLSSDERYRITIETTSGELGFNDSCTERVRRRQFEGVTQVGIAQSLFACGASTSAVTAKLKRVDWKEAKFKPESLQPGGTRYDYNLTSLVKEDLYQRFRIKALHMNNPTGLGTDISMDSDFTDWITVIDTPVTRAHGKSQGDPGQATLEWTPIEDILGTNFSGGTYSFRYHKLNDYTDPNDPFGVSYTHSEIGWQPWNTGPAKVSVNANGIIAGLELERIHAIQLMYEVTIDGERHRVHAGRNVYVWPSMRAAGVGDQIGERVATYPMNYPLDANNRTYAYHICEDSFPPERVVAWRNIIVHALEQWEQATDQLFHMEHLVDGNGDSLPCAQYVAFIQEMVDEHLVSLLAEGELTISQVTNFVKNLDLYGDFTDQDKAKNEIILIDDVAGNVKDLIEVGAFPELAKGIIFSTCIFGENERACAPRKKGINTTDILLRRSKFEDDLLEIPIVAVNECSIKNSYAYQTLVHESGHVLGIRNGADGYEQEIHHSSVLRSVMNYDPAGFESDCSPYPLDIMAIYALYQKYLTLE